MKLKLFLIIALLSTCTSADSNDFTKWVQGGNVSGNAKYYYIRTEKDQTSGDTASFANSIGGTLNYTTDSYKGINAGLTFMTTQPFALPSSVDSSIIGKDNGAHGNNAKKEFSVLGEAYISFENSNYKAWVGRKVLKTPLINPKEVRMLPSTVGGADASTSFDNGTALSLGYLIDFKQRTSSDFDNIIEHALGANTRSITGSTNGYVVPISLTWKNKNYTALLYDNYAPDFINSIYGDVTYKGAIDSSLKYSVALQGIAQDSIGNAKKNLKSLGSITGAKEIQTRMYGLKGTLGYKQSKFVLAYSNVKGDNNVHDSLVLPWDGTPLFTNMITANNLFQSIYGSALKADSAYIGGTQGFKIVYSQNYGFAGYKNFSSSLSSAYFKNSDFADTQRDYNAVISYKTKVVSVALKAIWVYNNSGSKADGTISQYDMLRQYRIIANYKF